MIKKFQRIYSTILVSRVYSTIITTAALSFHLAVKVLKNDICNFKLLSLFHSQGFTIDGTPIILFSLVMMTKFYVFCYYSSEVEHQSGMLIRDLFESINVDVTKIPRNYKSLIIIQENMKRSSVIKAGGYIVINMELFLDVLQSAYSTFAVLRQIRQ
jgi:hypothetical protein